MTIRFKNSNFMPRGGRIAYFDATGDYACEPGQPAWIHFSNANAVLPHATAGAANGDPFVIHQRVLGVPRVITHVVVPTGPIVLGRNGGDFPHEVPVRILVRMKVAELNLALHANVLNRVPSTIPEDVRQINDVLWSEHQQVAGDYWVANGAPYAVYGGASICTERLLTACANGQYDVSDDAFQILAAASQADVNH